MTRVLGPMFAGAVGFLAGIVVAFRWQDWTAVRPPRSGAVRALRVRSATPPVGLGRAS